MDTYLAHYGTRTPWPHWKWSIRMLWLILRFAKIQGFWIQYLVIAGHSFIPVYPYVDPIFVDFVCTLSCTLSCTGSTWSLAIEDAKLPKRAFGYHHDVIQEREFWPKYDQNNLCLAPLTGFNGDQNGSVLHGCHIGWLLAHLALQWVLQRENDNNKTKQDSDNVGTKKLWFSLGQGPNCLMAHDGKICLDNLICLLARTIRSLLGFAAKSLLELQHQSGLIHCSS